MKTMNILEQIVKTSRLDLQLRMIKRPVEMIQQQAKEQNLPLDLEDVLRGEKINLIAEVKKASPSKGVIRENFNPLEIAKTYANNGAAAISVLTEVAHFQGSLEYLNDIDKELFRRRQPLIRKDFIFDPYQVFETRAFGADALLLIVAILDPAKLQALLELSRQLDLSCLVETHNKEEVGIAVASGAKIIGINNRDLDTFRVDITTTQRLRSLIPPNRIVVSESGIKTRLDMENMRSWGVDAVLVGETLMASQDIAASMKELL
jgi:indole-3-glycerol phosphate synthase